MKPLFLGALAASLAGCSCFPRPVPMVAHDLSRPAPVRIHGENRHPSAASNNQKSRSTQYLSQTNAVATRGKSTVTAPFRSAGISSNADPVIEKAKTAVAGLMENPTSAQFQTISRGFRNFSGESIDSVCGHVKGKRPSGKDTEIMPFLYIVGEDVAYLVNGNSPAAEIIHRSICE